MNDSLEKCEIERCDVSEPLSADVCEESRRDKNKITKERRHRRIRDRKPSAFNNLLSVEHLKQRAGFQILKFFFCDFGFGKIDMNDILRKKRCQMYNAANDPQTANDRQTANDPQTGPQMIPGCK